MNNKTAVATSLDPKIIGQVQELEDGNKYIILKTVQCTRCKTKFFQQINYYGEPHDYKVCPFCHNAYWNRERMREPQDTYFTTKIKMKRKDPSLVRVTNEGKQQ